VLLLLEGQMHSIASLTVDVEYEGKEGEIKGLLLRFILKWVPGFPKEAITFRRIGKKSPAHRPVLSSSKCWPGKPTGASGNPVGW